MSSCAHQLRLSRHFFVGLMLVFTLCFSANAQTNETQSAAATTNSNLDERRVFALGMIETGNNDRGVGRAGEISRYQIHPAVWKVYSNSREYQNPEISLDVARQHWTTLRNYFKEKAAREPTDFDMYVLWNTRYGYYAAKGFDPLHLPRFVRDR